MRISRLNMILLAFAFFTSLRTEDSMGAGASMDQLETRRGASVVIMVDFSKSFARSSGSNYSKGLQVEDVRALNAVASGLGSASQEWGTMKIVWMEIQTSSLSHQPICVLETSQKLIKSGQYTTPEDIQRALNECTAKVVEQSKKEESLSDFTDISGGFAFASNVSKAGYEERFLIVLSDFKEDLPPTSRKADFHLNGERVILLHRPGTDEQEEVSGYLERINNWKSMLKLRGAKSITAISVGQVSKARIDAALRSEGLAEGTSLNILVDLNERVSKVISGQPQGGLLVQIARTLAELSRDWSAPVLGLWSSSRSSGLASKALPPLEFNPSLIKKPGALNTVEDFTRAMEECAYALPSWGTKMVASDISGSIALLYSVDPPMKSNVLIVISDFVERPGAERVSFKLPPGTRVIMVHTPSSQDNQDPNRYSVRINSWISRFKDNGATRVCEFPLTTFTPNDLRYCLN